MFEFEIEDVFLLQMDNFYLDKGIRYRKFLLMTTVCVLINTYEFLKKKKSLTT